MSETGWIDRAPRSGSLRTASDPEGSSAKQFLPGARQARSIEPWGREAPIRIAAVAFIEPIGGRKTIAL